MHRTFSSGVVLLTSIFPFNVPSFADPVCLLRYNSIGTVVHLLLSLTQVCVHIPGTSSRSTMCLIDGMVVGVQVPR